MKYFESKLVTSLVLFLIIIITIALRIYPLTKPINPWHIQKGLIDDAFYMYKEAQFVANGYGFTFDGINAVNTSRPLWMALLSVIWVVFSGSIYAPIKATLVVIEIFNVGIILLIYFILRDLIENRLAALFGALLYAGYYSIVNNGIETSASLFFLGFYIYILIRLLYLREHFVRNYIILGIMAGLTILFRIDYSIIIGIFSICLFLLNDVRRNYVKIITHFSISFLTILPWLLWSYINFKSILPPSGLAASYIFRGGLFYDSSFSILSSIKETFQLFDSHIFNLGKYINTGGFPLVSIAFILFIIVVIILNIKNGVRFVKFILPLSIALFVMEFTNILIRGFIRGWTMAPIIFLKVTLAAFLFYSIILWLKRMKRFSSLLLTLFLVISLSAVSISSVLLYSYYYSSDVACMPLLKQAIFIEASEWIKQNTEEGEVMASMAAGIMSYLSGAHIVDAIGIEDVKAYEAMKNKDLYFYLKGNDVKYIIEGSSWIDRYYKPNWGRDFDETCEKVDEIRLKNNSKMYLITDFYVSNWSLSVYELK